MQVSFFCWIGILTFFLLCNDSRFLALCFGGRFSSIQTYCQIFCFCFTQKHKEGKTQGRNARLIQILRDACTKICLNASLKTQGIIFKRQSGYTFLTNISPKDEQGKSLRTITRVYTSNNQCGEKSLTVLEKSFITRLSKKKKKTQ